MFSYLCILRQFTLTAVHNSLREWYQMCTRYLCSCFLLSVRPNLPIKTRSCVTKAIIVWQFFPLKKSRSKIKMKEFFLAFVSIIFQHLMCESEWDTCWNLNVSAVHSSIYSLVAYFSRWHLSKLCYVGNWLICRIFILKVGTSRHFLSGKYGKECCVQFFNAFSPQYDPDFLLHYALLKYRKLLCHKPDSHTFTRILYFVL